jgi:hypothetical protein
MAYAEKCKACPTATITVQIPEKTAKRTPTSRNRRAEWYILLLGESFGMKFGFCCRECMNAG